MPSLWPGWSSFWPSCRRLLYYWYCLPSRALPADSLYFHWAAQSPQQCRCAGLPVLQHSAGQVQVLGGDTSNTGAANGSLLGAKTDRSQILLAKPRVLVARVRISDWRQSLFLWLIQKHLNLYILSWSSWLATADNKLWGQAAPTLLVMPHIRPPLQKMKVE